MLPSPALRALYFRPLTGQLLVVQHHRAYASRAAAPDDEADLDAARRWFPTFDHTTIPASISKTTCSRSSGAGGQKVNKTSSKATTDWPVAALERYVPKILISELRSSCRYYVASMDKIAIKCDSSRSQYDNKQETHRKLVEEIKRIYKSRVPGVTSPEQKARIEQLPRKPIGGFQKEFFRQRLDSQDVRRYLRLVQLARSERKKGPRRDQMEEPKEARLARKKGGGK